MKRSMKRVSGAAAVLAVAAALALCGPAAYAAPAAPGDAQPLPVEAQPADAGSGGESGTRAEAAQGEPAQADGGEAAVAVSLSYSAHVSNIGWMGAVAGSSQCLPFASVAHKCCQEIPSSLGFFRNTDLHSLLVPLDFQSF